MKKIFYLWIILFISGIPLPSNASYVIELKNGTKFITNQYWEEGGQVKFYLYGGIAGFDKNLINSINASDVPYMVEEPNPVIEEKKVREAEVTKTIQEEVGGQKKEAQKITEAQKEEFLEKKNNTLIELENSRSAFNEAKDNKDKKAIKIHRKKLLTLNGDIQKLFNEVKTANGGEPPNWWLTLWPETKE